MPRVIEITVYTFQELLDIEKNATPDTKKSAAKAVERARDFLCEAQNDDNWHEYTLQTWKDALDQIGFTSADIHFSGFCSQGDGASFASDVDLLRLISFMSTEIEAKDSIGGMGIFGHSEDFRPWIVHHIKGKRTVPKHRKLLRIMDWLSASVVRISSHYSHSHTCRFETDFTGPGDLQGGEWKPKHNRLNELHHDWKEDAEDLRQALCSAIYHDLEEEYYFRNEDEQLIEMADASEMYFRASGRHQP